MAEGLLGKLPAPPSDKSGWPWTVETDPSRFSNNIDWPKISIVTPSYNQGGYIEETIRSILLQNYPNLEFIIMDGGSNDETVEVIKKYDQWITSWVSEKDNGQIDAIITGFDKCTGKIFNWINSDDLVADEALYHIGKAFTDPNINCVFGRCRHFNSKDYSTAVIGGVLVQNTPEETITKLSMGQPSLYFDRQTLIEAGSMNRELDYAMDTELWYKYLFHSGVSKIKEIDIIFSHFRLHDTSKTVAEGHRQKGDVNAIQLSMLEQIGAPAVVTARLREPLTRPYTHKWNYENINKDLLLAFFAEKMAIEYYTEHQYDEAKECMKIAKAKGYPQDQRFKQNYIKMLAIPPFFLTAARKVKNVLKN